MISLIHQSMGIQTGEVRRMIDKDIASALAPILTIVNALNVRLKTCERRREMSADIPALQENIARIWNDVNYLHTVDIHALLRPTEEHNALEKANEDDIDTETKEETKIVREELTAREEEKHIFGSLIDLRGTMVHHPPTIAPIGPDTTAQLQDITQISDATTREETA